MGLRSSSHNLTLDNDFRLKNGSDYWTRTSDPAVTYYYSFHCHKSVCSLDYIITLDFTLGCPALMW